MEKSIFLVPYLNDPSKQFFYAPLYGYTKLISAPTITAEYNACLERANSMDLVPLHSFENGVPILAISLTEVCNLRCRYCYAHGGYNEGKKTSTKQLIYSTLSSYFDFLKEKGEDKCEISFNGGCEATCAFDLMVYTVKTAEALAVSQNVSIDFSMTTNGYFNEEILNFIIKHFVRISLSFDGPEMIQNYHRPSLSGNSSYKTVEKNAKALYLSDVDLTIHVVVTGYNVRHLDETLVFFESILPNVKLVFSPMNKTSYISEVTPPNESLFVELIKALKKNHYNVRWRTVNENAFTYMRKAFCPSIARPNWFLTTDGRINTCMEDTHSDNPHFEIGYYDERTGRIVLDNDKINQLKTFNIEDQEDCHDCFARYICGGGCPNLKMNDKLNCKLIKGEALNYIHELYERNQTILSLQESFLRISD